MTSPATSGRFPLDCPSCRMDAGFPYQASTGADRVNVIRVAIRCRACGHEWAQDMPTAPPADSPLKEDDG